MKNSKQALNESKGSKTTSVFELKLLVLVLSHRTFLQHFSLPETTTFGYVYVNSLLNGRLRSSFRSEFRAKIARMTKTFFWHSLLMTCKSLFYKSRLAWNGCDDIGLSMHKIIHSEFDWTSQGNHSTGGSIKMLMKLDRNRIRGRIDFSSTSNVPTLTIHLIGLFFPDPKM